MSDDGIRQIFPRPAGDGPGDGLGGGPAGDGPTGDGPTGDGPGRDGLLDDAALLALYAPADRTTPRVRANFVASVDGSATASGVSGALGGPADKRVFDLLRWLADAVLVAAGTVRTEGYGAMRLSDEAVAWRVARGLAAHPPFVLVTGSLNLDPRSDVFAKAPVRPIVLTTTQAPADRRAALSEVADVIDCGETTVEPARAVAELAARGLTQIHTEGGPALLGSFIAADLLDALCLTVSPTLEGGAGPRITQLSPGAPPIDLQAMHLDHVLVAGSMLLTQYSRVR